MLMSLVVYGYQELDCLILHWDGPVGNFFSLVKLPDEKVQHIDLHVL